MELNEQKPLLSVKGLKKYFPLNKDWLGRPGAYLRAVDDISFDLPAGKTIGVVGESGCGKTTLGRTILKLYESTDGRSIYYGRDIFEFQPKYFMNAINNLTKNHDKLFKLKEDVENEVEGAKEKYEDFKTKQAHILGGLILSNDTHSIKETLKEICDASSKHEDTTLLFAELATLTHDLQTNPEFIEMENMKDDGIDLTKISLKEMRPLRVDIQLIFQDPYSSLPPRMTVGSIISEAVKVHKIVPKEQITEHVLKVMKNCGLQESYFDRYPHEFSGGQRQRICIARALAVNPKLVICDEPVSALDVSIQAQVINLLKELQNNLGLTYVFISHDLSVVKYITDKIMVMYLGNVMEVGDTDDIFDNPLHPYTQALFSAVPNPDPDAKHERIILEGDIPSPANPPKGCKFHTRCNKCMEVCKSVPPVRMEYSKNHFVSCHLYNEEMLKLNEELEAKALQEAIASDNGEAVEE